MAKISWLISDEDIEKRKNCTHIQDAWTINLSCLKEEEDMTDLSPEINDLLLVYAKLEHDLLAKEKNALTRLTSHMKTYVECQKERESITNKLATLKTKLEVSEDEEEEYE